MCVCYPSDMSGNHEPLKPWMTIRHCRMRLKAIEEVLSDVIYKVNEMHSILLEVKDSDE